MWRWNWAGLLIFSMLAACNPVDNTGTLLRPPALVPDGGPSVFDAGSIPPPPDAGPRDTGVVIVDAGPTGADDGEPCRFDGDCAGGDCRRDEGWRDGYCTRSCARDRDCQWPDSMCALYQPGEDRMCMARCRQGCRPGYSCQDRDGRPVCLPEPQVTPELPDGEPCTRDDECIGGTCLPEPGFPGGHCTTLRCDRTECASRGLGQNVCAPDLLGIGEESYCLRLCLRPTECRDDYMCVPVQDDVGLCLPDRLPAPPISPPEISGLGMQCGLQASNGSLSVGFTIAPDTTSYMITAFARDGRYVLPESIETPGQVIDFQGANRWQVPLSTQFASPILVPQTEGTVGQRMSGPHRFELRTNSQDVCWYLLEESTAGATLDLQIHLVGLSVDASRAPNDPMMQGTLRAMEQYLAPSGVTLGQIEYVDASRAHARRFSIVRSYEDFYELVATSEVPGAGRRDDLLTLHLFFVQGFVFPDGGPLGISSGLPGPAGLHGTRGSGVVASAEFMGASFEDPFRPGEVVDGNEYTGLIIAHEVGHYLGLFHTSEVGAGSHDPIADTAECRPNQFPDRCPDLGNLMFPLAFPGNTTLTAGQGHTVRANPLSKD